MQVLSVKREYCKKVSDRRSNAAYGKCLVMFVKYPQKGRVKSRLAASIGEEQALSLYRLFVTDILYSVAQGDYALLVAYDPPEAGPEVGEWLGNGFTMIAQSGDNLGTRIEQALSGAFERGYSSAAVIGSDSPDLPPSFVEKAFEAIELYGSVIGPTSDGGFYILGFRADTFSEGILKGISWSTEKTFTTTLKKMKKGGCRPIVLDGWHDIDTVRDLWAFYKRRDDAAGKAYQTRWYLTVNREILADIRAGTESPHKKGNV